MDGRDPSLRTLNIYYTIPSFLTSSRHFHFHILYFHMTVFRIFLRIFRIFLRIFANFLRILSGGLEYSQKILKNSKKIQIRRHSSERGSKTSPRRSAGPAKLTSKKTLSLNPEALDYLETLEAPIYAVSAIGPARVGKSFWLGQLARKRGFRILQKNLIWRDCNIIFWLMCDRFRVFSVEGYKFWVGIPVFNIPSISLP